MDNLLGTLPHIRQITILGIAAYFMSCGTSANAMSLVTQTSRPTCGKGADVMFGLTALSPVVVSVVVVVSQYSRNLKKR